MNKQLEYLAVKFCEKLPLNITLFEKQGLCSKPTNYCNYCKKENIKNYSCNKKTYMININLKNIQKFNIIRIFSFFSFLFYL